MLTRERIRVHEWTPPLRRAADGDRAAAQRYVTLARIRPADRDAWRARALDALRSARSNLNAIARRLGGGSC